MNVTGITDPSAVMAGQILTAMRRGDIEGLESGLEDAEQAASFGQQFDRACEQLELLGAVAGDMRHSIARFGRRVTPHLEGFEVHVQLLNHLARRASV